MSKNIGIFYGKCLKDINIYKEGETYEIIVNGLFSTRLYTPEEKEEHHRDFKKTLPENALKFIEGERVCVYNRYSHSGEAGYTVFESDECLTDYFKLQPKNV